jgi:hypothetical protein
MLRVVSFLKGQRKPNWEEGGERKKKGREGGKREKGEKRPKLLHILLYILL